MFSNNNPWSEEQEAHLRRMCAQGLTASQMMTVLAPKTRSAIISRIHRHKIPWTRSNQSGWKSKPRRESKPPKPRQERPQKTLFAFSKPIKLKSVTGLIGSDALWAGDGIDLFEATHSCCRFPFGKASNGKHICCGDEVAIGSYCEKHAAIVFTRPQQSRMLDADIPSLERVG